jgi:hypothetical protein
MPRQDDVPRHVLPVLQPHCGGVPSVRCCEPHGGLMHRGWRVTLALRPASDSVRHAARAGAHVDVRLSAPGSREHQSGSSPGLVSRPRRARGLHDASTQRNLSASRHVWPGSSVGRATCRLKMSCRDSSMPLKVITKRRAFLRAPSLDELRGLLNVMRGDTSLVGPRPLHGSEDAKLETSVAETRSRMHLGMTRLWQVRGRSDLSWDERVNLDDVQVRNWSLRDGFEILIETVPALFNGR